MKKIAVNIARMILAVVLIFSGFVKAVDNARFSDPWQFGHPVSSRVWLGYLFALCHPQEDIYDPYLSDDGGHDAIDTLVGLG